MGGVQRVYWVVGVVLVVAASVGAVQDAVRERGFTDYATDPAEDTPDYDRCKLTHRCNRARQVHNVDQARLLFTKQRFKYGARENADLFLDFENWRVGTMGLGVDHAYLDGTLELSRGGHFNSFEERHDIPMTTENDTLAGLFDWDLVYNSSGIDVLFDTGRTPPQLLISDSSCAAAADAVNQTCDWFAEGFVSLSDNGTEVAVFNFHSVFLGPDVDVYLTGNRSLTLISRSTAIYDTPLVVLPGTLGAFGAPTGPSPYNNNNHGMGSGALRVYMQTLDTFADNIDEVQTVTVVADGGQTVRGFFQLTYRTETTAFISAAAEPQEVERSIESSLQYAGDVTVTRSERDDQGGYTWTVTFDTALGDLEQMQVVDHLTGVGSRTWTETLVHGNTIGGSFQLAYRVENGTTAVTPDIPVTATEEELQAVLIDTLVDGPQGVHSVHVTRTDPTHACEHGLCLNGPQPAWGHRYWITMTTNRTMYHPSSPTRPAHPAFDAVGIYEPLVVWADNTTSSVDGAVSGVTIVNDIEQTARTRIPTHPFSSPVSLPFGGHGGANGGHGGQGHAQHRPPITTNLTRALVDITAGSTGSMGGQIAQHALDPDTDTGAGGLGGGALELIAVNDLIIGKNGGVVANGAKGGDGLYAGGGGSGGTILVSAGGVLTIHSPLVANGGAGGNSFGEGGRGGGGGSGGRIAGYAQSLNIVDDGSFNTTGGGGGFDGPPRGWHHPDFVGQQAVFWPRVDYYNGVPRNATNWNGDDGTVYMVSAGGAQYRVDLDDGAQETQRCLRLTVDETILNENGVVMLTPYAANGPMFTFPLEFSGNWVLRRGGDILLNDGAGGSADSGIFNTGIQPMRVTAYMKVAPPKYGLMSAHWGAHLALHEEDYRPTLDDDQAGAPPEGNGPGGTGGAGSGGPGASGAFGGIAGDGGEGGGVGNDMVAVVGVAMVDGKFKHQANYRHTPGMDLSPESPQTVGFRHVEADRWYKIDIFLNWIDREYKVRIDDVTVALHVPFVAGRLKRIGMYMYRAGTAWFDEIFVGPEDTMMFECPATMGDAELDMLRPVQTGWQVPDVGPDSSYHPKSLWESHLSRRRNFESPEGSGFVQLDGERHRLFHEDVKTRTEDGDHLLERGTVTMSSVTYVTPDQCPGMEAPRYYWYGDHVVDVREFDDHAIDGEATFEPTLTRDQGGVYSCSTDDFRTWRNEGIMLYNINVTDPLNSTDTHSHWLRTERPKVMFNNATSKYVMWMYADNEDKTLRVAAVAMSTWPTGPFSFWNTLHPDGNETTDFTVFKNPGGSALMARTYYANKTYFMPRPIMQPIWESVKLPGHDPKTNVAVDYAMNYHRAVYHTGYDNIDDIFEQRWRLEDVPWLVQTGNIQETYDQATAEFVLTQFNPLSGVYDIEVDRAVPGRRQAMLALRLDNDTFRDILGQGKPIIESRFKNPADNALWEPGSVLSVKSQPWDVNYEDKNIADNPVHDTKADLLIGPTRVVEVRRAKYLAISLLTDDYLNSQGVLETLEGEMENEDDLIVLLSNYGRFGWQAGTEDLQAGAEVDPSEFTTTYPFDTDAKEKGAFDFQQEFDWETRHWQFHDSHGDRRDDFVNFRDKQTSLDCPRLHNITQAKRSECSTILATGTPIVPADPMENSTRIEIDLESVPRITRAFHLESIFYEAKPTAEYEACQSELRQALQEYQDCIRNQLVDFNSLEPWTVGNRECVGGGGECGPPENGERPIAGVRAT